MENHLIRKRIIKIYAVILAICIPYAVWVLLTDIKIPCFYLLTTGHICPGCGTTRMFLSMFKLDFVRAFQYNPASFILFFMWNIIAVLYFWGRPVFVRSSRFLKISFIFSVFLL